MVQGLEVIIRYRGRKYNQVASPATPSSEFAILKKDLAHLRVHSPSQKNVQRVKGSFVLHWPTAGTSPKLEGLVDSLHTRWLKLCSDDPEARKLRDFLSIESITAKQDGVLLRSTAGAAQASQDVPPGSLAERLGDPPEIAPESASAAPLPPKPQSFPKLPPSAPRSDRQPPPHLKRRASVEDGPSGLIRQKLDIPEAQTTIPLQSPNTPFQPINPPTSPRANRQRGSSAPGAGDAAKPPAQLMRDDASLSTHVHAPTLPASPEPQTAPSLPPREPGEMTPHRSLPIPTPISEPSPSNSGLRPPTLNRPTKSTSVSPHPSSSSSGNGEPHGLHQPDRDVTRLTRELWDTRQQLTAMKAREQAILDDLERLGARPDSGSGGADRNGNISRDELLRLETELRAEKAKRLRAERALSDVERECRAPFVVPALFQAFTSISELSN